MWQFRDKTKKQNCKWFWPLFGIFWIFLSFWFITTFPFSFFLSFFHFLIPLSTTTTTFFFMWNFRDFFSYSHTPFTVTHCVRIMLWKLCCFKPKKKKRNTKFTIYDIKIPNNRFMWSCIACSFVYLFLCMFVFFFIIFLLAWCLIITNQKRLLSNIACVHFALSFSPGQRPTWPGNLKPNAMCFVDVIVAPNMSLQWAIAMRQR